MTNHFSSIWKDTCCYPSFIKTIIFFNRAVKIA